MMPLRPHARNIGSLKNAIEASTLRGSRAMHVPLVHHASLQAPYSSQTLARKIPANLKTTYRQSPSRASVGITASLRRQQNRPFTVRSPLLGSQSHDVYTIQSPRSGEPNVHAIFEKDTGTWQYVVADPDTSNAVLIDTVLDYDRTTQVITTKTADELLSFVQNSGYKVAMILETHVHADHITAASYLQNRLAQIQDHKPPIGIGSRIEQIQKLFSEKYGVSKEECTGVFGKLFKDDEIFNIGELKAQAIHLPGHTPDHLGYKIGDNVFCGDSIFHVDIGTARCDFPGGSAHDLYRSGRKLLSLPGQVKVWTGHDYPPETRGDPVPFMSVQDHRSQNKHLMDGITADAFVTLRKERDANLAEPRLLHQSLQMNIRAGRLPLPTQSGQRMLHLPLKLQGIEW